MDLKSYSSDPYAPYRDESILHEQGKKKDSDGGKPASEGDIREAIGHYSKMSNDQLMVELAKQIGMQKDKGNESNVKETIERIKPMLNAEQRKKMEQIIASLGL